MCILSSNLIFHIIYVANSSLSFIPEHSWSLALFLRFQDYQGIRWQETARGEEIKSKLEQPSRKAPRVEDAL